MPAPPSPDPPTPRAGWRDVLPFAGAGRDLFRKAYLIPGLATIVATVLLIATRGEPDSYFPVLGAYLCIGGWYAVYLIAGHRGALLMSLFAAALTAVLMRPPIINVYGLIFGELLPAGRMPHRDTPIGQAFVYHFFAAGLLEELLKATPALACLVLARLVRGWPRRLSPREPLDGILMGAAAGAAFAFIETVYLYVPGIMVELAHRGSGAAAFAGLSLLLPRIIGDVTGHTAYAAYFGYFIGLAALLRRGWWWLLPLGWVTAAVLHAAWNSVIDQSKPLGLLVGFVSYAFMVTAILRARQLSPNRANNFATRLLSSIRPPAGVVAATPPGAAAGPALVIAGRRIALGAGATLDPTLLPGVAVAAPGAPLATMVANPEQPGVLGLRNDSLRSWTATVPGRAAAVEVPPGRAIRLSPGTRIDFGPGAPAGEVSER